MFDGVYSYFFGAEESAPGVSDKRNEDEWIMVDCECTFARVSVVEVGRDKELDPS